MPDGRAFAMLQGFAQPRSTVMLVLNWFDELNRAGAGPQ
jgi:hypothetical protein